MFERLFSTLAMPKNQLLNTTWKKPQTLSVRNDPIFLVTLFSFWGHFFLFIFFFIFLVFTKFEGLTLKLWYKTCK